LSRVLIIEDERPMRRIIRLFLEENGHEVADWGSGEEAVANFRPQTFDVVLLDINLPGIDGLETLRRLRECDSTPAYIMLTAFGSIPSAVEAMRGGAFDYLTKPFDNDNLLRTVHRATEVQRLAAEVDSLRTELAARYGFRSIVGVGPAMAHVFSVMHRVAVTDVTVLVLGESGTGKEIVAREIHLKSRRADGPFVAVNCSAIPSALVETEFFGHERGAFTDAKEGRAGRFEQAHRGTLFLDEVADLALEAQAKLLRVIQDQEVTRVGGSHITHVDVRVIAATNKDLELAVAKGAFRSDLFWRLNVISIKLPPLRNRPEDIPALVDYLLEKINRALETDVVGLMPAAKALILAYDWPGNVRELENALMRACVLCQGRTITPGDLPPRLQPPAGDSDAHSIEPLTLAEAVEQASVRVERALLQAAFDACGGNRSAMALRLGINRKTVFNKMQQYRLGLAATGVPNDSPSTSWEDKEDQPD
jgi:DNA-binding NtrC family response regulator